MGIKKQGKSLMQRFEKLHLGMKALDFQSTVTKDQKEVLSEGTEAPALPSGATVPLVAATAQPLPTNGTRNVQYGGVSPDQINAITAVATGKAQPLDPNTLAQLAAATGTNQLLQTQGIEAEKSQAITSGVTSIFGALLSKNPAA